MKKLHRGNKILNLFLLLLISKLTIENNSWIYERNKNVYCEYPLCHFNIFNDIPFSPIIPYKFISKAQFLGDYHYIYLLFNKPKDTDQKVFFLEVNDTKTGQSLITGGDCYKIDLDKNNQYELQIYEPLTTETLLQLQFIGLNQNFFQSITLKFPLDIIIFAYCIKLDHSNSLWKNQQQGLIKYLEKLEQISINEKKIKNKALEVVGKIVKKLLRRELDITVQDIHNLGTFMFITNFAIITVSLRYNLGDSTERYFKDNEIKINEEFYVKGVLTSKKNMLDFLGEDIEINNNIKNLAEIVSGGLNNLVYGSEFGNDHFSLTISTCYECKYVNLIFRFYDYYNNNVYLEIDVKVEFLNDNLLGPLDFFLERLREEAEIQWAEIQEHPFLWGLKVGLLLGSLPYLGKIWEASKGMSLFRHTLPVYTFG